MFNDKYFDDLDEMVRYLEGARQVLYANVDGQTCRVHEGEEECGMFAKWVIVNGDGEIITYLCEAHAGCVKPVKS